MPDSDFIGGLPGPMGPAGPEGPEGPEGPPGSGGATEWGDIAGTLSDQIDLQTELDGKSATGHTHAGVYEPANANIQAHVISAHAPSNAQKNSDITLAEIEAKLVGEISSHTHAGGGAPDAHAASHENGGADEINVTGLTGLLATAQTPAAHSHAQADVTGLVADLAAKQPLDSDLTTIAGLTATTDHFMVAAASAWASRTPAQAKTSLALVKGDVGLGNVDNTSDANKPVSTAQQTALDLKANLASPTFTGTVVLPAQTVTLAMQANMATASVVYRKTAGAGAPEVNTLATLKTDLVLVKADVGLSNVDNTSDAAKPVSTATQTALDLKAPLASPTFTGTVTVPAASFSNAKLADMATKTYKGRTAAGTGVPEDVPVATLKTDLALGNVDNTSDVNKPVSTAQQTALNLKANLVSPTFTGDTAVDGGLHVGGASAAGDNNLLVDGTASITGALSVSSNSVIAGTGAAANNLIIRTDSTNSPGLTFQNNGGIGLAVMAATNAKGFEWLVNDGSTYGIEISSTGRVAIRNGGLHVGGTSDAGNDNLLVDGTATITGAATANGGQAVLSVTGGFPGGTANFLRADGGFAAPPGGAGGASLGLIVATSMGLNLS